MVRKSGIPSTCAAKNEYAPLMRGSGPKAFTVTSTALSHYRGKRIRIHRCMWEVEAMSKAEKQGLRYSDYYWCMSLKDFIEWVEADDDQEPATSYSDQP